MAPCFSVLSSEAGGQFFFTLETRIFKPVVFDRFQTDADIRKDLIKNRFRTGL
jgi:hypothetical protein